MTRKDAGNARASGVARPPWPSAWPLAICLALTACTGPIECCLVNTLARSVVEGQVVDRARTPVPDVEVEPLETFVYLCETPVRSVFAQPSVVRTDAEGRFSLELITDTGPGDHCVDFRVRRATAPDTTFRFAVTFTTNAAEPDTTFVEMVVE